MPGAVLLSIAISFGDTEEEDVNEDSKQPLTQAFHGPEDGRRVPNNVTHHFTRA